MRKLKYRIHEWLADHFSTIQYPKPLKVSDVEDLEQVRLDRRVRRVFWSLAAIWIIGSIGAAALSSLFEARFSPTPAAEPSREGQSKPRLHVSHPSDTRWT